MEESNSIACSGEEFANSSATSSSFAILDFSFFLTYNALPVSALSFLEPRFPFYFQFGNLRLLAKTFGRLLRSRDMTNFTMKRKPFKLSKMAVALADADRK